MVVVADLVPSAEEVAVIVHRPAPVPVKTVSRFEVSLRWPTAVPVQEPSDHVTFRFVFPTMKSCRW